VSAPTVPPVGAAGSADWVAVAAARMQPAYAVPSTVLVRGEGAVLVDAEGGEWLDLLAGIAVATLGHAHPAVTAAVAAQAATLVHTSNLFLTTPALQLMERLAGLLGWDDARFFMAQCGATANEAALKLARRHGLAQRPGKLRVVALEGSFHGRTLGTLELTGQPAKRAPFEPLAGFVDHVPYDDAAALTAAVGPDTCAVVLEVVQGEGGVRPVPADVLAAAREACDRHGALLWVDEVQTGIGRTGAWFAFQQVGLEPDVVTLAKGLGNGLPIGVCAARGPAGRALQPGQHGTTFGGNPVTSAAALAVLDVIEAEGLLAGVAARAAQIRVAMADLAARTGLVREVRGLGLLLGVVLAAPVAAAVEARCRAERVIVNAATPDVIRLAPPLVITAEQTARALGILADAIESASGAASGAGREEAP
jgi:acetylornithine/N-succinyldiaminopimelate aminotransferase